LRDAVGRETVGSRRNGRFGVDDANACRVFRVESYPGIQRRKGIGANRRSRSGSSILKRTAGAVIVLRLKYCEATDHGSRFGLRGPIKRWRASFGRGKTRRRRRAANGKGTFEWKRYRRRNRHTSKSASSIGKDTFEKRGVGKGKLPRKSKTSAQNAW
jgi:hypothetical protein